MIVRFRRGNITETRPVHGKLDHHVSAGRKQEGFKQLHVSVEFTKYGNTLFRPVIRVDSRIRFVYATCGRRYFYIRIKKFADTKISGYMWTGPKTHA